LAGSNRICAHRGKRALSSAGAGAHALMKKILLMSIILLTFILPMRAATNKSAVRGLRNAVLGLTAWISFFVVLLSVMNFYGA
jgi:hypothetical protein